MAKKQKKKEFLDSSALIPAGLLIGIGLGFLWGNLPGWTLIGLGVGVLAKWIFRNA